MRLRARIAAVLGPADPPYLPAPGRGRPRTQVERGSLGSGRPPHPAATGRPPPTLSGAERAALQRLADSDHALVARWPVGRAVARALIGSGLVDACSEWVWLTPAGRQAAATPTPDVPADQQQDAPGRPPPQPPRGTPTPAPAPASGAPRRREGPAALPPGVLRTTRRQPPPRQATGAQAGPTAGRPAPAAPAPHPEEGSTVPPVTACPPVWFPIAPRHLSNPRSDL